LMPLSAPKSVESREGTTQEVALAQAFLRALQVFKGDVSRPMRLDWEKSLFIEVVGDAKQEVLDRKMKEYEKIIED